MKVGIDLIHFATSDYFLGLDTFAKEKGTDVNKYLIGIGVIVPDKLTMNFSQFELVIIHLGDHPG